MTHASIPKEERDKIGIADTLVRHKFRESEIHAAAFHVMIIFRRYYETV